MLLPEVYFHFHLASQGKTEIYKDISAQFLAYTVCKSEGQLNKFWSPGEAILERTDARNVQLSEKTWFYGFNLGYLQYAATPPLIPHAYTFWRAACRATISK